MGDYTGDQSFTFNLEAYDESSDECSSGGLEIDISDTDIGEKPSKKRKHSDVDEDDEIEVMSEVLSNMEQEIERQLDSKAAKSNLTVANVKNILKHVITNEHVLAMVRHSMTDNADESLSSAVPFGPKLTRAKTRELLMTFPAMAWPMTPAKKRVSSASQVLIEQEYPEDSSDEEYKPCDHPEQSEEEEEKENESAVSASEEEEREHKSSSSQSEDKESESAGSQSEDEVEYESAGSQSEEDEGECEYESPPSQSEDEEETECSQSEDEEENETSVSQNDVEGKENKSVTGQNEEKECAVSPNEKERESMVSPGEKEKESTVSSVEGKESAGEEGKENEVEEPKEMESSVSLNQNESALGDSASQSQIPEDESPATDTSWLEDGLFNIPEENIGQRTRSKFSLSDTPLEIIERAFIPPDITTDMYDSVCDDEDWKNFLNDFTEPLTPDLNDALNDDDETDPEYNILADEELVDREELRVDKAVKISRKELNALMIELFEYTGMISSDDKKSKTKPVNTEQPDIKITSPTIDVPPVPGLLEEEEEEESCVQPLVDESIRITREQKLLIEQQLRKHVQLLTQNYMQTFYHPELSHYAPTCKSYLHELKFLAEGKKKSAFRTYNLMDALDLIDKYEQDLSSEKERKEYTDFVRREIEKGKFHKSKRKMYVCQFPPKFMDVVGESSVFMYPLLLPPVPFRCDGFCKSFYVYSEDELIALGLEQFLEFARDNRSLYPKKVELKRVLPLIIQNMLPLKDPTLLYYHIRKRCAIKSNPIKYYFDNKVAPQRNHFIVPCTPEFIRPPNQQPDVLLPLVWQEHKAKLKTNN